MAAEATEESTKMDDEAPKSEVTKGKGEVDAAKTGTLEKLGGYKHAAWQERPCETKEVDGEWVLSWKKKEDDAEAKNSLKLKGAVLASPAEFDENVQKAMKAGDAAGKSKNPKAKLLSMGLKKAGSTVGTREHTFSLKPSKGDKEKMYYFALPTKAELDAWMEVLTSLIGPPSGAADEGDKAEDGDQANEADKATEEDKKDGDADGLKTALDEDVVTKICAAMEEFSDDGEDELEAVFKEYDINAVDKDGQTPLHLAMVDTTEKVVQYLLDKGADREAKTTDGKTALDLGKDFMGETHPSVALLVE